MADNHKSKIDIITCPAESGWRISHPKRADMRNRCSYIQCLLSMFALNEFIEYVQKNERQIAF